MELLITEIMKDRGISVDELAKHLGVSPNPLYAKLRGNLTIKSLQQIAEVLDCEVADFFPVPDDYIHWHRGMKHKKKDSQLLICPSCGTSFKVVDFHPLGKKD